MQRQYNKKLNFYDYQPGDRAWLKKKHYKTGENRKLAPEGPVHGCLLKNYLMG